MSTIHFYAWKNGLKTGMYYLRSKPAAEPIKFTVDLEALLKDGGDIHIDKKSIKKDTYDKKSGDPGIQKKLKSD
jgi:ribonucleotide reductase alpha subunit